MDAIRVGLVADPAPPTEIARGMTDLRPPDGNGSWDVTVVSEPFTTGRRHRGERLQDHAREQDWDHVIGLTELPLHDHEGRHLLVGTDPQQHTAVLPLPALGGFRMHTCARRAVRSLVSGMADPATTGKMSWWRLVVATVVSIALGWLVIDGGLWDRPDDDSPQGRERSRLDNLSTLIILLVGVLICYVALYVVNLAWAYLVLDPGVMRGYVDVPIGHSDLFVLAWSRTRRYQARAGPARTPRARRIRGLVTDSPADGGRSDSFKRRWLVERPVPSVRQQRIATAAGAPRL
jgi:hypothetical protein